MATRAAPELTFSPPQPIDDLNTEYYEGEAFVHEPSRTIYFSSDRPGTLGDWDFYTAQFILQ